VARRGPAPPRQPRPGTTPPPMNPDRHRGPRSPLGNKAGHAAAYRMLRFAVPGAGRYPYQTSMCISMPSVPRSAWGRVAAGAADSLAAGLAQGAGR